MTLELEVDVPESRTIILPPEVPVGKAMVSVNVPSPTEPPTGDKFEREKAAFHRLLPELLKTHRGQYVAIHNEQVVETGTDKMAVAAAAIARFGNVEILVRLVTDTPRIARILSPKVVHGPVKP